MRIIIAHKFWYRRGGAETVALDEAAWLAEAGHTVAVFSTAHPKNDPSPWSVYWVPYLELGPQGGLPMSKRVLAAARLFYNREARRRFERLLDDFRPDIVHIHGIHRQISPSILGATRRREIPVVQTLHDCHHICPADVLCLRGCSFCEPRRCGELWYGPCVLQRCFRNSRSASTLSAAETMFQRVRRVYEHSIARFISPSRCLATLMRQGRWDSPIDHVPNAVPPLMIAPSVNCEGFVVVGRLAREKGVRVAAEAARRAGVRLTIAGEGPLEAELRAEYPEVVFTGRLDQNGIATLMARSRAAVLPSLWFENAPLSVLEAMAAGTPTIASAVGGVPEIVTDGVDGLLVPPDDLDALAGAMRMLEADQALARRLGEAARHAAATRFSPARHLEGVLTSYAAAASGTVTVAPNQLPAQGTTRHEFQAFHGDDRGRLDR